MKKAYIAIAAVFCSLGGRVDAGTITVYHTGDAHGWYSARPAKWDKENSTRTIGGFAALAALVRADKNPHILLDSGDTFQGTPEGNMTRGLATVDLMNRLGYSALLVGNHDYDYGEANLRDLAAKSSFTWLGANVYVKETGKEADYLKPYVIIEKAGKRIAVLGLAGRHTSTTTLPLNVKHLRFADEASEAARWMPEIRKLKPDAVIIMVHNGFSGRLAGQKVDISTWTFSPADTKGGTLDVAAAAGDAQVVLGSHVHTGLLKGYRDRKSGALIGESYWQLTDVTRVELNFDDKTGKFTGASAELVPLWTDVTGEAPDVLAAIKGFSETVDREMDKVIGESAVDLGPGDGGLDSPIGDWMTDVMRRQAGTDLAFQNSGGIRAGLKAGKITMRDVYQVMPFENTIVTLRMTGAQVARLIGDNLWRGKTGMQVSGLTVKFRAGTGPRPASVALERGGREIKPDEVFTVATNNYLTSGGTGGRAFDEGRDLTDTMQAARDVLIKDIREHSPITAPAGGRFIRQD